MKLDKKPHNHIQSSNLIVHIDTFLIITSSSQLVQKYFGEGGLQWSDSYSLSQDVVTDESNLKQG